MTFVLVVGLRTGLSPRPALGADGAAAARITKLNKQALDAFDNLNFDQAKALLEQAISESEAGGLAKDPVAARSHLNMGMLLIAGFQQKDQAVDHFKAALKIQPDIAAPAGLFNPEVQAVFDEVRSAFKTTPPPPPEAETSAARTTSRSGNGAGPPKTTNAEETEGGAGEGEAEEEQESTSGPASKFLLSLGLGSGFGLAKGHLDANRDSVKDSSWSGGLAASQLGHIELGVGYFVSSRLMLSLEGRIQIVTGTTIVTGTDSCKPSCSAPSNGIAVLAKANWFLAETGPVRPFLTGGLGAGAIRQVVKINIVPNAGQAPTTTGCGPGGTDTCVDTVTGGPVFVAVGGGVAYELGRIALLGSLTANVGLPNLMLNVDALLGLGLHL